MYLSHTPSRWISAAAAIAVVTLGGFTLDRGHGTALPEGVVELGEFQAADPMLLAEARLPELVITAERVAPSPTRLGRRGTPAVLDGDALAPVAASAVGVLLK